MSNWIDKHSVNCFVCGVLFDERDGIDFYPEGEICPDCLKDCYTCESCGFVIVPTVIIDGVCPNCKELVYEH